MIEKLKIQDIPFVDGVPNPESRPDQARIDWLKDGECIKGASTAIGNEGSINRYGVAIQKNVKQVLTNVEDVNGKVSEVIDQVNLHQEILGQVDNLDLIETVQKHTDEIETLNFAVTQVSDRFEEVEQRSIKNENNIGAVPEHDTSDRTIRGELEWQKNEMGSYPGFDYNGFPNVDSAGAGMKLRIVNNTTAIGSHQKRINDLEKTWVESDVGNLTKEVNNLRAEVGSREDHQVGHPIYSRLNRLEQVSSSQTNDLEALIYTTDLGSFPRPGALTLIELVENQGLEQGIHAEDIAKLDGRLIIVERQIGDENTAGTIIYNQKVYAKDIKDLYTIVGKNNSEGLRYSVVALETELGTDSTPGTVKNRILLTEQGIRDLNIKIDDLNELLGVDGNTSGSFSERVKELELQMNGDPNGVSDYEKQGVYRVAYDIMMAKPIYDVTDSNLYYRTKDAWIKVGSKNIKLDSGIKITSDASDLIGVDAGNAFVGQKTKEIDIRSRVKDMTIVKGRVYIQGEEKDFVTTRKDGSLSVVDIGASDTAVNLVGEVRVNNEPIGQGNVKDVLIEDVQGVYMRSHNKWVRSDQYLIPFIGLTHVTYDVNGQEETTKKAITIDTDKLVIGTEMSVDIQKLNSIRSDELIVYQKDSKAISITDGSINFGKTSYVNNSKIWTDATDAPKDNEYYARRDGVWEKIDPTGSGTGSGVGEAPDDEKFYTRHNYKWIALGERDINILDDLSIRWETNTANAFTGIKYNKLSNSLTFGGAGAKVEFLGDVKGFTLEDGAIIKQKTGAVATNALSKNADSELILGDIVNKSVILRSSEGPKAQIGAKVVDIWHSDLDAASDSKIYGRKNGAWVPFEVNRTLDIILNQGYSYKVADGANKLLTVATAGASNLIELGQKDTLMNINSTVRSLKLDNKVSIKSVDGAGEIELLGLSDTIINFGNVTKDLKIKAKSLTLNDQKVWTQADDAPADGARYARMNNKWEKSYTYGSAAPNSVGAQEGDVYFQFM